MERRPALSPAAMLTFAAVARAGGIRRAEVQLEATRSTISRHLAELEAALGGRLIARTTRRFALTDLGDALLRHCAQLEEVMKASEAVALRSAQEPVGRLSIATSPIVGEELLPRLLAEYARRYPRVTLQVALSPDFVDLRRAAIDVAVRTGPLEDAGDVYAVRLGTSLKGHYASPAYLAKHGTPREPRELSAHDCIVIGEKAGDRWALRSGASDVHVPVAGTLRVDSYRLARSACAAGVGIARLPRFFAEPHVKRGELTPILERHWPRNILYAVHTAERPVPLKIRAFIDLLKKEPMEGL